jgi:hypothetical protein
MGDQQEQFLAHEDAMQIGMDFISYYLPHLPNSFLTRQRHRKMPVISWTVRDEQAVEDTYKYADQMTFEGFDPRIESASMTSTVTI